MNAQVAAARMDPRFWTLRRWTHAVAWIARPRPILIVLFFGFASIAMMYPLSLELDSHVADAGDPLLDAWILTWVSKTIVSNPGQLFQGNIFYPFPYSVAFSETLAGIVPIAGPVLALTGNPLLALNIVVICSFWISGVGAYALVKHLTGSTAAGIIAGLAFSLAPYRFNHQSHVQLLSTQWMPLALLFLIRGFEKGRWADFVAFSLLFLLEALSSFYYALYFGLSVALFVLYVIIFRREQATRDRLIKLGIVSLVAAAVIVPFTVPYFEVQRTYGFSRSATEADYFSADLSDYLVAPPSNFLYRRVLGIFPGWPRNAEVVVFPGLIAPLLAAAGLFSFGRTRQAQTGSASVSDGSTTRWDGVWAAFRAGSGQGYFAILAGTTFLLTLGPSLHLFGNRTGIPLPYLLLHDFVPGFKGLRAPARFDIILMLGLAVLAGYGVLKLQQRLPHGRIGQYGRPAIAIAIGAGLMIENASMPVRSVPVATGNEVPQVYRWLADQPDDTVLLELPAREEVENARYAYFSTYHWRRLVNGYSGFTPPGFLDIVQEMDALPSAAPIALLQALKVNLVIFHAADYPEAKWESLKPLLDASPMLTLVHSSGKDYVYRIVAPTPADGPVSLNVDSSDQISRGRPDSIVFKIENQGQSTRVFLPTERIDARVRWTGPEHMENHYSVPLPFNVAGGESSAAPMEVQVPGVVGTYSLEIQTTSPLGTSQVSRQVDVTDPVPDSLGKTRHSAIIGPCDVPLDVNAGSSFHFACNVRNDGRSVWLARPTEITGWVGLGVRFWRDGNGKVVIGKDGNPLTARAMAPSDLRPGQSLALGGTAVAPSTPGTYVMQLDIVSEAVAWFGDLSASEPRNIEISVR